MIIDFHTHNFPDALAPKAMASLAVNCAANPDIVAHTDGTAADAKRILSASGVDRAVVCNIATNARQENKVNSYALSLLESDFFIPLGSLHPDSENKREELTRLKDAGIKGIKLHPDYVGIELTDERYDEIFLLLCEFSMFCVVHAGYDPISPEKVHAAPEMFRRVIDKYPDLKLAAAHMGGFSKAEEVLKHLVGQNIYLDTSLSSLRAGEKELLHEILSTHDENKLLFGTDTPWTEPKAEIEFIKNAPISEERKEKIFYKNALSLLG